jgi:CheY-like chemotaxis protein
LCARVREDGDGAGNNHVRKRSFQVAKVLVIDDSSFQRGWLVKSIRRIGYETVEAENGCEGLKQIEVEQPGCIVTDLLMPEMDGLELMENLKDRDNSIPVIVVTADIQAETQAQCQELGVRAILHKPFKESELQQALGKCLGEPSPEGT